MFDLPEHLRADVVCLRVECLPYAPDEDGPVQLLLLDGAEKVLATLRFTPERARDAGPALSRLLAQFLPRPQSYRVADGLLKAAVRVWAARN